MRPAALALCAVFAACAGGALVPSASPSSAWDVQPGCSLALRRDGHEVWRWHFGPDRNKPCFHPLALPGGLVLTRDQPEDHRWHHGLWFSWKFIDGVNYWENEPQTGRPAGGTAWTVEELGPRSDGAARIALRLTYGAQRAAPVLAERRTIAVGAPGPDGAFEIDWVGSFTALAEKVVLDRTPLPGEPGGQVFGGYAGLSLRLCDLQARAAVTTAGAVAFNAENRFRGRDLAFDYHGTLEGRPVGVAILAHRTNLNSPSPWYAIRSRSMSFVTPAVLCYGAHTLRRGEDLVLRYRVLVHQGAWDAVRLQQELDRFHLENP